MRRIRFFMFLFASTALGAQAGLRVRGLAGEHMREPFGVETANPRFSWKLDADQNGEGQTAYQILVAEGSENQFERPLWDSGWVDDTNNRLIPYAGSPLDSLHCYGWKVRVKDVAGQVSGWSDPARFITGLLPGTAPSGKWIFNPSTDRKTGTSWFRKSVVLDGEINRALVLLASRTYHELYVNGRKAGDRALAPNASILEKRTLYEVYDIAPLLKPGENTLAVWVGPARLAASRVESSFLLFGQIGGQDIESDATWKTRTANLSRYDLPGSRSMYGGERWNAAAYLPDWNQNGLNDSAWDFASVRQEKTELSADLMPPTRYVETIFAKTVDRRPDGTLLVDFGRYFTGQLEAQVHGEAGKPIRFATLGDLKTPNYFGQFSEVIPGKDGKATFHHRFNWMCGRWLEVSGLSALPKASDFKVHRIGTDFDRIGFFSCSDELLNRIYETDLNTYRNLTLDGYNHDCTHRERRGYGEHAFGTSRGMAGSYDLTAFVRKWLRDWRDVQKPDGYMPHTAPEGRGGGGTLWSSFTVLGPWDFYLQSGDRRFLSENRESAQRWMDYLDAAVVNGMLPRYENKNKYAFLGDWARPVPPEKRGHDAHVASFGDNPLALCFNNGIYALDLQTMSNYSSALGYQDEAREWQRRLETIRPAIHKKFFNPESGVYLEPNQVLSMLAELTGITPSKDLRKSRSALDSELNSKNYIDAGSAGLTVFMEYIVQHPVVHQWFFDVLHRKEYPGYSYFLEQGYDTWPELWDPDCSSKVHSCYVGVSSFFTRVLAGLQPLPEAPGYKRFSVNPSFVEGLNRVSCKFDSPQGWIRILWERNGKRISLKVVVPPDSSAEVFLPSGVKTVGSGEHLFQFAL